MSRNPVSGKSVPEGPYSSTGDAPTLDLSRYGEVDLPNNAIDTAEIQDSAVTAAKIASDILTGVKVATVADVNTVGGIPVLYRINAVALSGNVNVTVAEKIRVIDAWCVATAAGAAADTITVSNGASAITNAMDLNVADNTVVRAGTIDDANHEIAAAGTLRVVGASAVNAVVYVLAIRVA